MKDQLRASKLGGQLGSHVSRVAISIVTLVVANCLPSESMGQDSTERTPGLSYWSSLKSFGPSDLFSYLHSHSGEDDVYKQAMRKSFEKLRSEKVGTPESAVQAVLGGEDADEIADQDRLAAYRVVELVRSSDHLKIFGQPTDYIWVVRQVDSELRMLNQYWVSATTGEVRSAFKVRKSADSVSSASIKEEIAKAWSKASFDVEMEPFGEAVVFGNLLPELVAIRDAQAADAKPQSPLVDELKEAEVSSRHDAFGRIFRYINSHKMSMQAEAAIHPNGLVRLGRDVEGFSSEGDLVWIVEKLFPPFGIEYIFLVDAKSGRVLRLFEDEMPSNAEER